MRMRGRHRSCSSPSEVFTRKHGLTPSATGSARSCSKFAQTSSFLCSRDCSCSSLSPRCSVPGWIRASAAVTSSARLVWHVACGRATVDSLLWLPCLVFGGPRRARLRGRAALVCGGRAERAAVVRRPSLRSSRSLRGRPHTPHDFGHGEEQRLPYERPVAHVRTVDDERPPADLDVPAGGSCCPAAGRTRRARAARAARPASKRSATTTSRQSRCASRARPPSRAAAARCTRTAHPRLARPRPRGRGRRAALP